MSTLAAADLYLSYGEGNILDGLSLEVRSGEEPVGLIGPSGVGKTTLIATLYGELKPAQGTVKFDDRPVSQLRMRSKREFQAQVRAVSQYSMTVSDPRITVADRLKAGLKTARKGGRGHETPIPELMAAVGLQPQLANRAMITLSGGERQREALATALATRPEILLLDEPLTALDPPSRTELAQHLRQLITSLGIGVLLASHDLELVERLCPTVHAMAEGKIVATGPLSKLLDAPENSTLAELAVAAPLATQRFR